VKRSGNDNSLDDLLDSLGDEVLHASALKECKKIEVKQVKNSVIMCHPVYLSNSNEKKNSACAHLRCAICDHNVIRIANSSWNGSEDYLFFRNNFPNISLLKSKTKYSDTDACYCCQCQWTSVQNTTVLKMTSGQPEHNAASIPSQVRWNCSGI
jgi:hypothetical protein